MLYQVGFGPTNLLIKELQVIDNITGYFNMHSTI
ncbi:hypothetical protein WRSd5_00824 [Shigella dysenteriae WRSd5]|nr:hypothetical protein WRSd5_00824 [Shigella dysenteriae WRSd5]KGM63075.1 hypothetical protein EL77_4098 [Escherichia coli]KGM70264.1 hypothetical protein EL78_4211 [Escherichia coli]